MFFWAPEFLIFLAGLTKLHPPFPDCVTLVQLAQPNRTTRQFHLVRHKISRLSTTKFGVADFGYEGLNMQVRKTSIHKTSGFSSYFFHTLIKQRQKR